MTARRHSHLRRRDLRFLATVAAALACIVGFLLTQAGPEATGGGGWRRIDREALERRIESGELSGREASWYRVVDPARR
jgi:hypothetical protein